MNGTKGKTAINNSNNEKYHKESHLFKLNMGKEAVTKKVNININTNGVGRRKGLVIIQWNKGPRFLINRLKQVEKY